MDDGQYEKQPKKLKPNEKAHKYFSQYLATAKKKETNEKQEYENKTKNK